MIAIRPAQPRDREAWVRLRSELWPERPIAELAAEAAAFVGTGTPYRLGGRSIPFAVFVAEDGPVDLRGFIEVSVRPFAEGCESGPVGYLEGWYVSPGARRSGVGGRLVREAERWAIEQGCTEMASDALAGNTVSESSHRALGYEVVERDVHFRRSLTPDPRP